MPWFGMTLVAFAGALFVWGVWWCAVRPPTTRTGYPADWANHREHGDSK